MLDDLNLPANPTARVLQIVEEYDRKKAAIPETVKTFGQAVTAAEMGASIGGAYVGSIWYRGSPSLSDSTLESTLLQSAWRHVYAFLNLDKIAPASDRSRFDLAMKDPAPFTFDNIRATFGKYIADPRAHILRGLAECFSGLDPAFKSHDRMKIGVKGLPKRIILSSVTGYGGWGTDRLLDTINALRVLNGQPRMDWSDPQDADGKPAGKGLRAILDEAKKGDSEFDGMTLRRFANGNAHLIFSPDVLLTVNRALAEYYGEVLPDCPEETPAKATGTAVARDLQFYRTPAAVADELVERAGPRDGARILEPSCGDGAILDALRRYATKNRIGLRATGVEYDGARAEAAKAKGFGVMQANFLQVQPDPVFDFVLMNPPFYGKHYQKHVEHARKFLKPDGVLYAILPITAVTDHGYVEPGRGWDVWKDLAPGSFSESGTNINTGIVRFFAPK